MADYKDKLDEWQQAARRKARELDEKFAISDLVGEGASVAVPFAASAKVVEAVGFSADEIRQRRHILVKA